ncbi:MAG: tyrosine-type recombinase/integrase [Bacteroidales bacterium]|nr:tyrosine-type recombinase/integrase [Bacteroidales bacterium]
MSHTFSQVALQWCKAKCPIVKHSTYCAYTLAVHTHLVPHFGTSTCISEADVQQFIMHKLAQGLARKTVKDLVAVLRAIVKYGSRHSLFSPENWVLEYPTSHSTYRLPTLVLTHQRQLMRHLVAQPTAQNIGILLALCTGMRIGEVCALQWADVDLRLRLLRVQRTIGRVYNCELRCTEKIVSSPKTCHSSRDIPIAPALLRALRIVRMASAKTATFVVGAGTQAKEPRTYRDYFARLLKRLGLPSIVFHGLRHTFATRCIESQCDIKTISAILGHANVSTTLNLYVHPDIDQKKRCVARMSKYIGMLEEVY